MRLKPLIVLVELIEGYEQKLLKELKGRFNVSLPSIQFELIGNIPQEYSDDGRVRYSLNRYNKYKIITDYYPLMNEDTIYINDIEDTALVVETIAGFYLNPKVYFTDDLEIAKRWISKLPETFAWDTETMARYTEEEIEQAKLDLLDNPRNVELTKIARSNALMPHLNKITMSSFSIAVEHAFVLIHTPEIEAYVLDFLVETKKKVICHNLGFDMRLLYNRTGKHLKNYEDTQLIAQAYLNSVDTQLYGLKPLAGHIFGDWANDKASGFNLYEDSEYYQDEQLIYKGSNKDWKQYNLPLIKYAGIDAVATLVLWEKFSSLDPLGELVSIDNILPIQEPKDYENNPRYFYENVMKPIVPTMIELVETPMPIDLDVIEEIKQEALDKKLPAFEKLQNYEQVKTYMETVKEQKIREFLEPLVEKNRIEDANPKMYKHTPKDRMLVCNELFGETREKWTLKDIKDKIKELENEE